MKITRDSIFTVIYVVVTTLLLFFLFKAFGWCGTSVSFSLVDSSCYSKVTNIGQYWDKSVEYAGQDLTLWNELYIIPYSWSIDTTYRANLSNGLYRGLLSGDFTYKINKGYTVEAGLGVYVNDAGVYPMLLLSNRTGFKIWLGILEFKEYNYLYFPVGKAMPLEMLNDLELRVNVMVAYFKVLNRTTFENNVFKNYVVSGIEVNF